MNTKERNREIREEPASGLAQQRNQVRQKLQAPPGLEEMVDKHAKRLLVKQHPPSLVHFDSCTNTNKQTKAKFILKEPFNFNIRNSVFSKDNFSFRSPHLYKQQRYTGKDTQAHNIPTQALELTSSQIVLAQVKLRNILELQAL